MTGSSSSASGGNGNGNGNGAESGDGEQEEEEEEEEECEYTLDDYDAEDESVMELRCVQAELLSHQVSLQRQWQHQQHQQRENPKLLRTFEPRMLFTAEIVPVLARRLSKTMGLPVPVVREALSVTHTQVRELLRAEAEVGVGGGVLEVQAVVDK
jgi:hypothetical protein